MSKTLREYWEEYRDSVYPDGMTEIQIREIKQAFFSATLCMFQEFHKIADDPSEDSGVERLERLRIEAIAECARMARKNIQRN